MPRPGDALQLLVERVEPQIDQAGEGGLRVDGHDTAAVAVRTQEAQLFEPAYPGTGLPGFVVEQEVEVVGGGAGVAQEVAVDLFLGLGDPENRHLVLAHVRPDTRYLVSA
ncbi:hypothetical protein Smic_30380 [Streptomyces microflavus]|uniref:Uncharacterized protein n=1 Tax=Streptomyces microflavus TaxID=1919 RepID=A0A7J0CPQ7_STRMI|nr:hypothetical protein Smic_30380 [Streptomyces microflavus]